MMTKKNVMAVFAAGLLALTALPAGQAEANTAYYYVPSVSGHSYQPPVTLPYYYGPAGGTPMTEAQLRAYLQQLIMQLQAQLAARQTYYYYPSSSYGYGYSYVIGEPRSGSSKGGSYYDDEPEVRTRSAAGIDRYEARLRGDVDMNDYRRGEVFFVYGTDRDRVEDVERDYDSYSDVTVSGERLRKVRVDSALNSSRSYDHRATGLSRDTQYYFSLCVGYEDDRGRDTLTCGDTLRFRTDN